MSNWCNHHCWGPGLRSKEKAGEQRLLFLSASCLWMPCDRLPHTPALMDGTLKPWSQISPSSWRWFCRMFLAPSNCKVANARSQGAWALGWERTLHSWRTSPLQPAFHHLYVEKWLSTKLSHTVLPRRQSEPKLSIWSILIFIDSNKIIMPSPKISFFNLIVIIFLLLISTAPWSWCCLQLPFYRWETKAQGVLAWDPQLSLEVPLGKLAVPLTFFPFFRFISLFYVHGHFVYI